MSPASQHRPDIDGLRAIAVLAILFFHAEFRWALGGFRGVDMFFVISGFLITGILLREQSAGRFSLASFYERRARRILPALFVTLAWVTCVAYWLLMPVDLRVFGQTLTAIVVFASNVLFWKRAGGTDFYFEPSAHLNPLLHTWSLGVEEQFYLVFPLLLWLVWRFWPSRVLAVMVSLALTSFIFSSLIDGEWGLGMPAYREANFYLLPSRVWQLGLGAIVACLAHRDDLRGLDGPRRTLMAWTGLALVAYSLLAYDVSDYRFPSIWALPATIGTALVLAFGQGTSAGRVLSLRPLVAIGLISYSVYLWHQPLFAFAHYVSLSAGLSGAVTWSLCGASLVIAWASWRLVETPFRSRARVSRAALVGPSVVGAVLLVSAGLAMAFMKAPPLLGRLVASQGLLDTLTTSALPGTAMRDCAVGTLADVGCALDPSSSARPRVLVFGDSHAGALLPAFRRLSQDASVQGRLVALRLCPPLLDVLAVEETACLALQTRVLEFARRERVSDVFLVARWAGYTDGDYDGHLDGYLSQKSATLPRSRAGARSAIVDGLKRTVDAYRAIGATVYLVPQVPLQVYRPLGIYLQALVRPNGGAFIRRVSVTQAQDQQLQSFMTSVFATYVGQPGVRVVDLRGPLCADGICPVGDLEHSFYWDESHLNNVGAARVTDTLIRESGFRATDRVAMVAPR